LHASAHHSALCAPNQDDRENWEGLCNRAVEALCSDAAVASRGGLVFEKIDVKSSFKRLAYARRPG